MSRLHIPLAVCLVFATLSAGAQMMGRHGREGGRGSDPGRMMMVAPQPLRQNETQNSPRHEPEQRGTMSLEERRQLRRDIHEAGRELYRREPPAAGGQ